MAALIYIRHSSRTVLILKGAAPIKDRDDLQPPVPGGSRVPPAIRRRLDNKARLKAVHARNRRRLGNDGDEAVDDVMASRRWSDAVPAPRGDDQEPRGCGRIVRADQPASTVRHAAKPDRASEAQGAGSCSSATAT